MQKPYMFRDDQAHAIYGLAMAAAKDARDTDNEEEALHYEAIAETILQQLHTNGS